MSYRNINRQQLAKDEPLLYYYIIIIIYYVSMLRLSSPNIIP